MGHIDTEYAAFIDQYPRYVDTHILDDLRDELAPRFDHQVYMDYAGTAPYSNSLLEAHFTLLQETPLGNPHSLHEPSRRATELIEAARSATLQFFNADPNEYDLVFTSNTSQALRIIGSAYPFTPDTTLLMLTDAHNSQLGIRCDAEKASARVELVPIEAPELHVASGALEAMLDQRKQIRPGLFIFPPQSNFSGAHHSLTLRTSPQILTSAAY